jgi:hypothetical protein
VKGTSDEAISRRLRLSMVAKTKDDTDLKGEKTTCSLIISITITSKCQGHECNFVRATSRAYK